MGICGSTASGTADPVGKYDDTVDEPINGSGQNTNKHDKSEQGAMFNGLMKENRPVNEISTGNQDYHTQGNDHKDAGLGPADESSTNPVPNLQLIDGDENEEYIDRLQQAYQRRKPSLTREYLLSDIYKMEFPRRGKAIVINNERFLNSPQRNGTYVDFTRICNRLERLGFEVERHKDVTCNQIMAAFVNTANCDHSDADCFACVFLSHGGKNEIHGIDGELKLTAIFELFKSSRCKTLAGKPKLFFVQSCRGEDFDDGSDMNVVDAQTTRSFPEDEVELTIPDDADFLISYSTVSGYYSWRNSQKGSWYIQALVRVLDECGTMTEIQNILTRVNKMVALEFESRDPNRRRKKQVPSFTSKLTKDLYFDPK